MANCSWANQISNRNFLSGIGFKFNLGRYPKIDFFCNSARIPELRLSTQVQSSYLKDIDLPGEKITYGDLTLQFLVDENMENYKTIYDWIYGLGFPETPQQFKDKTTDPVRDGVRDMMYIMIYNNYSHMASVNEQMLTNSEWIAFQQEANSQPSQAATLLRSGIANMAGYFE